MLKIKLIFDLHFAPSTEKLTMFSWLLFLMFNRRVYLTISTHIYFDWNYPQCLAAEKFLKFFINWNIIQGVSSDRFSPSLLNFATLMVNVVWKTRNIRIEETILYRKNTLPQILLRFTVLLYTLFAFSNSTKHMSLLWELYGSIGSPTATAIYVYCTINTENGY